MILSVNQVVEVLVMTMRYGIPMKQHELESLQNKMSITNERLRETKQVCDKLTDRMKDKQKDSQTERLKDKQTDTLKDRTYGQTDRKMD